MENNPYLHFYKEGELDYSGVQIYELKIDPSFVNSAARGDLTFDVDEDLLDIICELPSVLSQSQPLVSDVHQHERKKQVEKDPADDMTESIADSEGASCPDDHEYKDDELAHEYADGKDCCYEYATVQKAKNTFKHFTEMICQRNLWDTERSLFRSFITSSNTLNSLPELPLKDYEEWKSDCHVFVKGNLNHCIGLSKTNSLIYAFN
jgi:hypothetical protein